jgi:hypothetical protein
MRKIFFPRWLLLLSVACSPCFGAGIVFQKERVDAIILSPDTLEIRGIYWFVNEDASPTSAAVYYPFPIDSFSIFPHYITLARLFRKQPIRFDTLQEGIRWNMTLAAKSGDSVQVVYRQHVNRMQGRYIVTTAKLWGRPLQSAEFSVKVPAAINLDYWSYQYDTLDSHKDTIIYYFHRAPFSPDADILMRWRCTKSPLHCPFLPR